MKSITSFIIATALLCAGCSCSNYSKSDTHPEYFSKYFKMADTASNQSKEWVLAKLDSAYRAFPNPGVGDRFAIDSFKRDYYSYVKGDYWKAIQYADTLVALTKDRIDEEIFAQRYARALIFKGMSYYLLHRYDDAYKYHSAANEVLVKHIKDKCALAEYGGNAANLLYAQGKYIQAATAYYDHYILQLGCGKDTHARLMILQGALNNVGVCYYKAGLFDSASRYHNAALKIIEDNEQKFPQNYFSIGNAKGVIYAYRRYTGIEEKICRGRRTVH